MVQRPAVLTSLAAAVRYEFNQLVRNPAAWLLSAIVVVISIALGRKGIAGVEPVFGPLKLGLFLTLVSTLLSWHTTTRSARIVFREILTSRAADEWLLHTARVLVIAVYGGLLTCVFFLNTTVSQVALAGWWLPALAWLPHVFGAHLLAAAWRTGARRFLVHRRRHADFCRTGGTAPGCPPAFVASGRRLVGSRRSAAAHLVADSAARSAAGRGASGRRS